MAKVRGIGRDMDEVMVEVKVGDYVGFKSDYEQYGEVVKIDGERLTLRNENGFGGEYLRYATETVEFACYCWKEID